ncbi:MAG: hypothetical protein ACRYF3_12595, partial [Janthinobacterium lividum]
SDGWAAWFLVLAAALPVTVIIRLGSKVLTGSADEPGGSQVRVLTGLDLLGDRWSLLWMIGSLQLLLLTALLPLVVLAALVLVDRPRWLVPSGAGRLAATLVAAVTALLGLTGSAGVIAQVSGLLPGLSWGSATGSQVEAYGPVATVVCTTTVLGAISTVVLWPRRGAGLIDRARIDTLVEETVVEGALQGRPSEEGSIEPVVPEAVVARSAPHRARALPDVPVPSASDLDLYRRR